MRQSIEKMTAAIADVMDGRIHSIWLYGSVVLDDFQLGWSDIDFIALTRGPISEAQANRLLTLRQALLAKDPANPYYRSFEGIIADLDEYRSKAYTRLIYWGTSGQRIAHRYEQDAFSALGLAKYGKSVYGKADRGIFQPPTRSDILAGIRFHYETIRKYARQTDERLYSCGWLLDIARCLYTLKYNDIISKSQAGIWALEHHVFPDEQPLIRTIAIRRHPLQYQDSADVRRWLSELGPVVQRYADVLEAALAASGQSLHPPSCSV